MNKVIVLNQAEISTLVVLINQGRLSEAEHKARALLNVYPNAGMLWKILSIALMRQGKDSLQALRRTTELMPQDAEAHGNLGVALHDQGQWALAWVSLQQALAIQPHDLEVLVAAANALKELGQAGEAVPLYQRALQRNPRLVEAHNNLGNAFLQLGRYDDAVGCYRCALKIKPDEATIFCNLGYALWQLGFVEEAIPAIRRAIVLEPGLSVAHNNLGLILVALGRRDEAVASYRQALLLNPSYMDALNNLGNELRDLGAKHEAVSLYARAVELDPTRAESHCNLGNALLELRRIDEADRRFRQALALQPAYTKAHVSLATVLRLQRRTADAEVSCRAALAIDPNNIEALSLLGELCADRGQFTDAETLFRRALDINPDFAFGFFSIAAHRKMTPDDKTWLTGVESLLAKRPSLGQEISLRYALGKYFNDIGQYDSAFTHYRQANELTKRHGTPYDRAKLTQRVDEIIRSFDADFAQRFLNQGSTSELPVFIIGMPRSGTSLTEQILASHPAVFGVGELVFWDAAYGTYEKLQRDGKADAKLISGMTDDYLDHLMTFSEKARRVVDKMPSNFLYAGLMYAAFPRARIIHMRRHPIDTCLSIYFQHFFNMGPYANDFDDLAHYYGEYIRITNHWRAVLPTATLLEVPYEGLIEDQEGWTRRMLDFIGLPWDPKCLDFHQTDRVVITSSKWQVRQKLYATSTGRWRHYEKFLGPLQSLMNL